MPEKPTDTTTYRREEAAEARKEEREAKDELVTTLKEQLAGAQAEKATAESKYTSMSRWFVVMLSSLVLLLLLFIGAMIGVVQAGNVHIPGIGQVTVGSKGNPPPPQVQPEPAP